MITVGLHILCARRLFDFMADNYLELPGKRSILKAAKQKGVPNRIRRPMQPAAAGKGGREYGKL